MSVQGGSSLRHSSLRSQGLRRQVIDYVAEWNNGDLTENSDDEFVESNSVNPRNSQRPRDHFSHLQTNVTTYAVNPFLSEPDIANLRSTSTSIARRQPPVNVEVQRCVHETENGVRCLDFPFLPSVAKNGFCDESFCQRYRTTNMFLFNFLKLISHGLDIEYSKQSFDDYKNQERYTPQNQHTRTTIAQLPFRALRCDTMPDDGTQPHGSEEAFEIFGIGKLITMSVSDRKTIMSKNKGNLAKFVESNLASHAKAYFFTLVFHDMNLEECIPKTEFSKLPLTADWRMPIFWHMYNTWCSRNNLKFDQDGSCQLLFENYNSKPYVVLRFAYANPYYTEDYTYNDAMDYD